MTGNTKRKIFYIWIMFCPYFLNGQEVVGGSPGFFPEPYNAENIDVSIHNIFFEYSYVDNPNEKSKTKSALTVLQIGRNFSKFTDFHTLKLDSLREKHSHLKRIERQQMNEQLAVRKNIGFKMTILKDLRENTWIFQSRIPSNDYEFVFPAPELRWKLESDYKIILGFKTQKATIRYSGRDWTAWFAESIPIPLGPYTFGNLPGLILELYDKDNNHHFLVSGMDAKRYEIYQRIDKKAITTTKREFFRTEKSFHERPDLFFDTNSVSGVNNFPAIPYNPIELDF